jgi:hypothetical protein
VVPRPIVPPAGVPVIIILTPNPDESINANSWQPSFNQHAANFKKLGVQVEAAPWLTSPLSSDSSSSIYVANLTWGYHLKPVEWNTWLSKWPTNVRLINSPKLLEWNTRKTYLNDLEEAGVPVIPTIYVDHVDEATLENAAAHFGVADLVVKPQVSASSHNIMRVLVGSDDFIIHQHQVRNGTVCIFYLVSMNISLEKLIIISNLFISKRSLPHAYFLCFQSYTLYNRDFTLCLFRFSLFRIGEHKQGRPRSIDSAIRIFTVNLLNTAP